MNSGNSLFNEDILNYLDGIASLHVAILKAKIANLQGRRLFDFSIFRRYICKPESLPMTLNRQYIIVIDRSNFTLKALWSFKHKKVLICKKRHLSSKIMPVASLNNEV